MHLSRYSRQEGIQDWNQAALSKARVLVIGAGALGNELIKNLALLGIGQLLVVDLDRVEFSNLSRSVLFRDTDVGRPKAQVVATAAAQLNPDVDVRYIDGDLFHDLGLGFYRHSDLVVSCLDNLAARSQVGLGCVLAGVPFLDGGMWALGGEVRWFMAGDGPCFDCTLDDGDRARAYERRSCTGFFREAGEHSDQPQNTTAFTAAVIGGLLAQETVRYLCGLQLHAGEALVYNGLNLTMHRSTLSRNPECLYHSPYQDVIELPGGAAQITATALLRDAENKIGNHAIVELGRDFLPDISCEVCHRREDVNALLNRVEESRVNCGQCGQVRSAQIVSRVDGRSPYVNRVLGDLGVPTGEILAVRNGQQLRLYELSGDIYKFWT